MGFQASCLPQGLNLGPGPVSHSTWSLEGTGRGLCPPLPKRQPLPATMGCHCNQTPLCGGPSCCSWQLGPRLLPSVPIPLPSISWRAGGLRRAHSSFSVMRVMATVPGMLRTVHSLLGTQPHLLGQPTCSLGPSDPSHAGWCLSPHTLCTFPPPTLCLGSSLCLECPSHLILEWLVLLSPWA